MSHSAITRQQVAENYRMQHTANLFGIHFPLNIEPTVYSITSHIAPDYAGGYWDFYTLSNGGFYMQPATETMFDVICDNGYEGKLSGEALGVTVCLYAYSHLSFSDNDHCVDIYAKHYHLLREFMLEHSEATNILKAID